MRMDGVLRSLSFFRINFLFASALLLSGLSTACRGGYSPRPLVVTSDSLERTVLAAAILRASDSGRTVVITDTTFLDAHALSPLPGSDSVVWAVVERQLGPVPPRWRDEFVEVNKRPRNLPGWLPMTRGWRFLSEAGTDTLLRSPRNDGIWGSGGEAPWLVRVSRPAFSTDQQRALILVGAWCGGRCGHQSLVLLTRENGSWHVIGDVTLTRS